MPGLNPGSGCEPCCPHRALLSARSRYADRRDKDTKTGGTKTPLQAWMCWCRWAESSPHHSPACPRLPVSPGCHPTATMPPSCDVSPSHEGSCSFGCSFLPVTRSRGRARAGQPCCHTLRVPLPTATATQGPAWPSRGRSWDRGLGLEPGVGFAARPRRDP